VGALTQRNCDDDVPAIQFKARHGIVTRNSRGNAVKSVPNKAKSYAKALADSMVPSRDECERARGRDTDHVAEQHPHLIRPL
jgi:hypothetical protein